MAENHVFTRPSTARKTHRYQVDEALNVRFLCHANSTHVLQTLWRGLVAPTPTDYSARCPLSSSPLASLGCFI
jgi:hypothetical protein